MFLLACTSLGGRDAVWPVSEPSPDLHAVDPMTFDGKRAKEGLDREQWASRDGAPAGERALYETFHVLDRELGSLEELPTDAEIDAASKTASLEDPAVLALFERYREAYAAQGRDWPQGLP